MWTGVSAAQTRQKRAKPTPVPPSISRMAECSPETPHHDLPNGEPAHLLLQPLYFLDIGTANLLN